MSAHGPWPAAAAPDIAMLVCAVGPAYNGTSARQPRPGALTPQKNRAGRTTLLPRRLLNATLTPRNCWVIETAATLRRLVPPKTWTAWADGVARPSAPRLGR